LYNSLYIDFFLNVSLHQGIFHLRNLLNKNDSSPLIFFCRCAGEQQRSRDSSAPIGKNQQEICYNIVFNRNYGSIATGVTLVVEKKSWPSLKTIHHRQRKAAQNTSGRHGSLYQKPKQKW
jgi:hypothetical protein